MADHQERKICPGCQEKIAKTSSKCPYCGKDLRNWFIKHPIISAIIAIFVLPPFFSGFFSGISSSTKKSSSLPKESVQISKIEQNKNSEESKKELEEEKQKKIENLSNTFCEKRQGKYAYNTFICSSCIDLKDMISLMESTEEVTIKKASSPAISEDCKKISELCLETWGEENCLKIAEQKIWIGMNSNQLLLSWGIPEDQNNTVGSWGINSQWVYGDFGPYVYLEGNTKNSLKVTSWQD